MHIINEKSRHTVSLSFTFEDGAPMTPENFTWRLQNPLTGSDIVAPTQVIPTGATHQLVVSSGYNTCAGTADELRLLTITVPELAAAEYVYKLKKLTGVTP
jgi:hypothetical protein